MQSSINWDEVRKRGIDRKLYSDRAIAREAEIHYNSIGKEGPYLSTTLDKLVALFGCSREDLLTEKRVESKSKELA